MCMCMYVYHNSYMYMCFLQYTHTSPQDDWSVSDHGQVAPARSSDVDCRQTGEEEEEKEDTGLELEVNCYIY